MADPVATPTYVKQLPRDKILPSIFWTLVTLAWMGYLQTFGRVDARAPPVSRAIAVIILAPVLWNAGCRLEFETGFLTGKAGPTATRTALAHYAFSLYIVLFSSLREWTFTSAIASQPRWSGGALALWHGVSLASGTVPLRAVQWAGVALTAVGVVVSMSGFVRLRIRGTYMGEYFGYSFDALIEGWPFNYFPDPMYWGSAVMHWGEALRSGSATGLYLAALVSLGYYVPAKLFEEPFMHWYYNVHKPATKDEDKKEA